MKISGRRGYLINLESVAMTDIVLNMFIFFFISFSLLYTFSPHRIKQLDVKLPSVESGSDLKPASQATVTITKDGPVYLDGKLVTRKELKEKMSMLRRANSQIEVVVYADRSARFKDVVEVLDVLTEAGIKNLNIAAEAGK